MKWPIRLLKVAYIGLIAALPVAAMANYAATVGAGTNFGSVVIGGVHFASQLLCDMTTANQCAAVNSSGQLAVNIAAGLNANGQATMANSAPVAIASNQSAVPISAASLPLPTGAMGSTGGTVGIVAGTAAIGTITGNVNVTPTDCSIALTTGGTAQNIVAASATIHGVTIANIDTSAGSGEPVWISLTTTAAASTIGSYPLAAPTATTFAGLSSYTTPLGFGVNHAISVVAATTGHKISCTTW